MLKFSANLGFLWKELELCDAIRMATKHGFSAIELHWPYETPAFDVATVLKETGLEAISLNTIRGHSNEFGLSALPEKKQEARASIDQAVKYAEIINASCVHVLAGNVSGNDARDCFVENLQYACGQAANCNKTILIEPINSHDLPEYFLTTCSQARHIIEKVDHPNLKLMFDCYHVQVMEGQIEPLLQEMFPLIGHIQFSNIPNRSRPDIGEIDYTRVFKLIEELGYSKPLGAEYNPAGSTADSLGWMRNLTTL